MFSKAGDFGILVHSFLVAIVIIGRISGAKRREEPAHVLLCGRRQPLRMMARRRSSSSADHMASTLGSLSFSVVCLLMGMLLAGANLLRRYG
jgi:hypothetical protein